MQGTTFQPLSSEARREELWTSPDLMGRYDDAFWTNLHPEDVEHVRRAIEDAVAQGTGFDVQYRWFAPSGALRWVHDRAFRLHAPDGSPMGIFGVAEDVTEVKHAQEELESTRRQMAQSERLAALGSLVSGLAHEIRTPLAIANNHLAIVSSRLSRANDSVAGSALQDVPGHIAATTDALDRINRLVEGLRRFTRLEPGRRERIGLESAVAEAIRLFQSAHRGHVDVKSDLYPTTPIDLDKVQIEQVVLRLLENAADSMAGGTVRVTTRESPLAVELIVEDTGPGIPRDIQPHIFDEFFTTKPGRPGLGLSIARRIVEAHGGAMQVRSVIGDGATFVVSFPKRKRDQARMP